MSNIHGLGSVSDRRNKHDDEEEFSVGGAQSATSVLRPTKKDDPILAGLMEQAKNHQGDPTGTKLAQERCVGEITLYKNGLKIGDGEFRSTSDPANQEFIAALQRGEVPAELEQEVRAQHGPNVDSISIQLVNKMSEEFVPKFSFAKSKGQALGGSGNAAATVNFADATPQEYKADASKETTTIQIVLHPRKRVRAVFNHSSTVMDVYRHVQAISGHQSFDLLAGFPPRALSGPSATVAEAKLVGASVQQRLK